MSRIVKTSSVSLRFYHKIGSKIRWKNKDYVIVLDKDGHCDGCAFFIGRGLCPKMICAATSRPDGNCTIVKEL